MVLIYGTGIVLAFNSIYNNRLSRVFRNRNKKISLYGIYIGVILLGVNYVISDDFNVGNDIYPVNVCKNVVVAIERNRKIQNYYKTS